MFSIIIPVYNVEKHLEKCLKSILLQTFKHIEIIIVNDGSTDNSAKIIEKHRLQDSRIKVITQKNRGLSAARNNGLKIATKKYVIFVDSDDYIETDTCERLAEFVNKDKSDVYVFGLFYNYGNHRNIGSQNLTYEKHENGTKYMETSLQKDKFRTFSCSKIFKIELLGTEISTTDRKIRFVEGLLYEDMYFIVQVLCKAKSVTVIPEYFYHYVQHQSGRITTHYRKKDLDVLTFINMLNNNYYKTEKINSFIYAVLVFRWVSSCIIYKYIKNYFSNKKARKMINDAIKDNNFIEAVKLCSRETGIPRRDKHLARILNKNPFLYKIIVYLLITIKNILSGNKFQYML